MYAQCTLASDLLNGTDSRYPSPLYTTNVLSRTTDSDSQKIVDCNGRIIVHLGGRPHDKSFKDALKTLDGEMEEARTSNGLPQVLQKRGLRGDHPNGTYGYTYPPGGGYVSYFPFFLKLVLTSRVAQTRFSKEWKRQIP